MGSLSPPSAVPDPHRLRLLQVVLDLEAGGLERVVADLVRGIDPARFELHVLALSFLGRFAEGLESYATLHVARPLGKLALVWPRSLVEEIRRIGPDIVHSHSGVWYKASLAARLAGVPWIVHTEHGRQKPDPWLGRKTDWLASRRTDVVVSVSEVLAEQLARTVVSDAARIRVLPNGVDTDAYRPRPDTGELRAELGLSADVPVIGSLGRLDHIKGYDVMVEAYAHLLAGWTVGAAPVLLIAGDGPDRAQIEALVEARGLKGRARILGWRRDVHALHAACTLFTLASRSEGTSISLLEAMSAGLCPVVTDVGGNARVLGTALTHRLAPAEAPAALARAWIEALADSSRRALDGRMARERVCREYSVTAMVQRYEATYLRKEFGQP